MKKATLFILFFFCIAAGELSAQQKYGHINSTEIVQAMPEFKQLTEAVDKRKKDAQTRLEKMYADFQTKQKELNDYGASMMEAVRQERMSELDSLQRVIGSFQETANGDLRQLQEKLLQPINDKYLKTVSAVAKENGYTYIFDIGSGSIPYYPEKTGDISDMVKKKLGIN
jgi:outer membrane protein